MELLIIIANISGGILLGLATLDKWDGDKNFFNKIAGVLAPFQTLIGGTLVVISLLRILHNPLLNGISLLGGFLLLTHVLGKAPAFKDSLLKLSDKLSPFKALIGIAILAIGIWNIIA